MPTTMGCYEYDPKSWDVSPRAILNPKTSVIVGNSTPTSVEVRNLGTTTITNISLSWSVNDIIQPKYVWNGVLQPLASTSITLGVFMPLTGTNTIKIWIDSLNAQLDEKPSNDTILASFIGCDSLLSGSVYFRKWRRFC